MLKNRLRSRPKRTTLPDRDFLNFMTQPTSAETPPAYGGVFSNATVLLTLTTLFWGGNAVAGKFAVGEISPFMLTSIRWLIAAAVLLLVARPQLRKDWPAIRARLPYLLLLGGFGYAVFNATLYTSLKYTTAINVTILQSAMPMMIFILNFVFFRTQLHWAQALGYSVTLIGVALTASGGDLTMLSDLALNKGDVLMLIATFIYAGYSVALRSRPSIHWLSFLTMLVTAAAFTSLFFAAFEIADQSVIWPTSVTAWTVILYTVAFPSIIGQAFFARGVELIGSNRASLFLNLVPIFGSILAVLLLGETFHLYHAASLVLVMGGIAIAQNLTPKF